MPEIIDDSQTFASYSTTLRERGTAQESTIVSGATIPIGGSIVRSVSVPMPSSTVNSMNRYMISGSGMADIEGYWFIQEGHSRPAMSFGGGNHIIYVTNFSDGTYQNFVFQFYNNTGGAPVALPTYTLTGHCRFYDAPWEEQ